MLDDLLGRTALKERIEALEADLEHLEARYEAEADRRAEAVTARQEAERRCNRLEDRIAQLEGELERVRGERTVAPQRPRCRLRGGRLEAVLARLRSVRTDPEGALTCPVVEEVPEALASTLNGRERAVAERAPCVVCIDDAGLIAVVLEPPCPPTGAPRWSDRFHLEEDWFRPTGRHALALIRADRFAVGVYEGETRVSVDAFESDVKGAHSKGGFSQSRFERIREEQIASHLEAAVDHLAALGVEPLYCVGQAELVEEVAASVPVAETAAVDATGDPASALEDAARAFWTTVATVP